MVPVAGWGLRWISDDVQGWCRENLWPHFIQLPLPSRFHESLVSIAVGCFVMFNQRGVGSLPTAGPAGLLPCLTAICTGTLLTIGSRR